jgi:hypothetical protein
MVLTHQAGEQDHADHAHQIERVTRQGEQPKCTNQRQWQAEHDDERVEQALEQQGHQPVHQQHAQA